MFDLEILVGSHRSKCVFSDTVLHCNVLKNNTLDCTSSALFVTDPALANSTTSQNTFIYNFSLNMAVNVNQTRRGRLR